MHLMLPDPKNDKKENRKGTHCQFRYLSAEMLQKSRQISEEQNMWKRQIERAEFRAYGTRPSGQKALDMRININATPAEQSNGQVRVRYTIVVIRLCIMKKQHIESMEHLVRMARRTIIEFDMFKKHSRML